MMQDDIKKAAEVLKRGGVILFPADTGWSLGCDATNAKAIETICRIKKREDSKSMLVLMENPALLERYVDDVPEIAWELVEISVTPLILIFPNAKNLASNLLSEEGSVGIRFIKEGFIMQVLQRFRRPVVSASASWRNEKPTVHFDDIPGEIKNAVDYVVENSGDDFNPVRPPGIIKLWPGGRIEIIRK